MLVHGVEAKARISVDVADHPEVRGQGLVGADEPLGEAVEAGVVAPAHGLGQDVADVVDEPGLVGGLALVALGGGADRVRVEDLGVLHEVVDDQDPLGAVVHDPRPVDVLAHGVARDDDVLGAVGLGRAARDHDAVDAGLAGGGLLALALVAEGALGRLLAHVRVADVEHGVAVDAAALAVLDGDAGVARVLDGAVLDDEVVDPDQADAPAAELAHLDVGDGEVFDASLVRPRGPDAVGIAGAHGPILGAGQAEPGDAHVVGDHVEDGSVCVPLAGFVARQRRAVVDADELGAVGALEVRGDDQRLLDVDAVADEAGLVGGEGDHRARIRAVEGSLDLRGLIADAVALDDDRVAAEQADAGEEQEGGAVRAWRGHGRVEACTAFDQKCSFALI